MNVSIEDTSPEAGGAERFHDSADYGVKTTTLDKMATDMLYSDNIVMPSQTMASVSSVSLRVSDSVDLTSDVIIPTLVQSADPSSVGNAFSALSSVSVVQISSSSIHSDISISPSLTQTEASIVQTVSPVSAPTISSSSKLSPTPSLTSASVLSPTPSLTSSSKLSPTPSLTSPSVLSPTLTFSKLPVISKSNNSTPVPPSPPLMTSQLTRTTVILPSITPTSTTVPEVQTTTMVSAIPASPDDMTTESSGNVTVIGRGPPPAASISLGLAIGLPICIAVLILLLAVGLRWILRRRHKNSRKGQRTQSDKELWMNTTLELPPLPPSPGSVENGHIIPLSEAHPPNKGGEVEYEVIHDFEARLDSQLSLVMGQILSVFEKADNGWWRGCRGNKMGWFPSDYVKRANEKSDPEILEISTISEIGDEDQSFGSHPIKPAVSSFLIRKKGQEDKSPAELLKESKGQGYKTDQNANGVIPNGNIQATEPATDETSEVLATDKISKVPATDETSEDVRDAALNSPDGGSSVDVQTSGDSYEEANTSIEEKYRVCYPWLPDADNPNRVALSVGDIVTRIEDIDVGWVQVRKDATGEEEVLPHTYLGSLELDPVVEASHRIRDQLQANRRLSSGQEHLVGIEHRAIYPYTAQHAEDLSFEEGDMIVVLNALENGWWHGLKGEEAGWFPGSYLELKGSCTSSPPGGIYDKGGNFLSDQSTSGSQTSSQNSSQADLVKHLSEALLRRRDSQGDTVSNASASTLGSDESRPKPVRKAPAPPGGTKSVKKKLLRRPSRPAPPPPGPPPPPSQTLHNHNPSEVSATVDSVVMRNSESHASQDKRISNDSSIGHYSDTAGEKPSPPKRFVTPKMVKIPKRKLKLQNSTMLPSAPERPVPPRPQALQEKRPEKKSYKKKASKKSKKLEPKYRGSVNKLSKADISGPMTLGEVNVKTTELVSNQMNEPMDLSASKDEVFEENVDLSPRLRSPNSVPVTKQRLEKSQSHIPPPVAPKPKHVSLNRLSQKSNRSPGVETDASPWAKTPSPLTNGNVPNIVVSEPEAEPQLPVPSPRRRSSSTSPENTPEDIPIEIVGNRSRQRKKSLKKATCNYTGRQGELSYEEGSFIKQMQEDTERPGWYVGMLADGTVGLFQHSNVEDSTLNKHSMA